MANSFPGSGLAYADAFSVGTANSVNSSLYVCSSCVQATRIEHIYSQTNLHHNTLWLRAMNSGARAGASIGFTVVNNGGDHHRANIEATANSGQLGGNLALYTRNNNGNDQLGYFQDHAGNVGIGTSDFTNVAFGSPSIHVVGSRATLGLSSSNTLATIALTAGNCSQTALHINHDNTGTTQFYNYRFGGVAFTFTGEGKFGVGTTSPIGNTKADIRTSCPLTAPVGQPLFVGSNETTGPLGVVIQHLCGHGVCRVDFTSTRYGVSGNDLSLNVDSSDPNTGGGLYVKYRGNVGISTSSPCTKLSIKCSTGGIKVDLLSLTTTDGAGSQPTLRFDTVEANCNVLGRISVCDIAPYAGTMIFETSACKGAGSATTTEVMRLVGTTGNIGMGTTSPSYRLHVNGTFYAAGSSVDYKQGICQYNTDSCMFMCLKPVTYQYKDEWKHLGKELKSETQIGLIAEDVAEVYPELAILVNEEDEKVVRNVDYEKLSIILLSELQKLRAEVDELKSK